MKTFRKNHNPELFLLCCSSSTSTLLIEFCHGKRNFATNEEEEKEQPWVDVVGGKSFHFSFFVHAPHTPHSISKMFKLHGANPITFPTSTMLPQRGVDKSAYRTTSGDHFQAADRHIAKENLKNRREAAAKMKRSVQSAGARVSSPIRSRESCSLQIGSVVLSPQGSQNGRSCPSLIENDAQSLSTNVTMDSSPAKPWRPVNSSSKLPKE